MKKLLLIFIATIFLAACGNSSSGTSTEQATKPTQKDYVEILYFHGKQRCATCNAIEKLTTEVIKTEFAKQFESGEIVFRIIDISTKEGEQIADKYEVSWSSLYINQWKDGSETRNNLTDFGFSNAKDSPDVFKDGIKKKIEELLK